jgi:hypothetical protein
VPVLADSDNQPLRGYLRPTGLVLPYILTQGQKMVNLTKKEALSIIHDCAVAYRTNLVHKNLLIISVHKGTASYFEVAFLPRNFLHLTGVRTKLNSTDFFRMSLKKRLCEEDIDLPPDGTVTEKLSVLMSLMNIHYTARMVGEYNYSGALLVTDKLAGTVSSVMGFNINGDFYVPNTALNTDIRKLVIGPARRVAAMFIKEKSDEKYSEMTYLAKGLSLNDESLKKILAEKTKDIHHANPLKGSSCGKVGWETDKEKKCPM